MQVISIIKKILTLAAVCSLLAACSSWGSSSNSKPAPNDPTVGSRDSSDMLFGQAAIEPGQTPTNKRNRAESTAR